MSERQTTLLWNNQKQAPESVYADEVQSRLDGGGYSLYEGSKVEQTVGGDTDVTVDVKPEDAGFRARALNERQALGEAAKRSRAEAEARAEEAQADLTSWVDAAEASYLETFTLGMVDPTEGDTLTAMRARAAQKHHPGGAIAGKVAAIGVTLLPTGGGSAAVRGGATLAKAAKVADVAKTVSPLGAVMKVQEVVTGGLRSARVARGGRAGILPVAAEEAIGGGAAGLVSGIGTQIGNAIQGRPVSGDAIIDEVGLGTVLGGGLGVIGGAFGKQAARIKNGRGELEAAAEFDKLLPMANEAFGEGMTTWRAAHREAQRRMSVLDDLESKGMLDDLVTAEGQTGKKWLGPRRALRDQAAAAEKQLLKTAGVESVEKAVARFDELVQAGGKAKEIENLATAFGRYGKAVEKFDEALRLVDDDMAHLLNVNAIDDIDARNISDEVLEAMAQRQAGQVDDEVSAYMRKNDLEIAHADTMPTPVGGPKTAPLKKQKGGVAKDVAEETAQASLSDDVADAELPGRGQFDVSDAPVEAIGPAGRKTFDLAQPQRPGTPSPKDFDLGDLGPSLEQMPADDALMLQLQASKRGPRPAGSDQLKDAMARRPTREIQRPIRPGEAVGELPPYQNPAGSERVTQPLRPRAEEITPKMAQEAVKKAEQAEKLAKQAAQKAEREAMRAAKDAEKAAKGARAEARAEAREARAAAKEADRVADRAAQQAAQEAKVAAKAAERAREIADAYTEVAARNAQMGKSSWDAWRTLNSGRFANRRPTTELTDRLDDVLRQLQTATGQRLGTEEARLLARELGVNLTKIADAGPLAEKMLDVWALKKLVEAVADETTGVAKAVKSGKAGALRRAIKSGLMSKTRTEGRKALGPFAGGALGSLVGSGMDSFFMGGLGAAIGSSGILAGAAGRFRTAATVGIAKALNPTGRRAVLAFSLTPAALSYDGSPATDDFDKKAEQIRNLVANKPAIEARVKDAFSEMGMIDPVAASGAIESSMRRITNLERRLPQGVYRGPFAPPGPPTADQLDSFHAYEAVTWNRELVFQYIRVGAMPDAVANAMREQHPDFLNEILTWVTENPDAVKKAPYESQVALSRLLGMPIVPEADPLFVQRQQVLYQKAKEDAAQTQMSQQGASMMRGGMPAAPPMTPAQQFAVLPSIR